MSEKFSHEIVRAAVQRGDFAPLARILSDVNGRDDRAHNAGLATLAEVAGLFCDVLKAVEGRVKFRGAPIPTRAQAAYAFQAQGRRMNECLQTLVNGVSALQRAAPDLVKRISLRETTPKAPKSAPPAAPMKVEVINLPPPPAAPMEVKVVSMPTRKTSSLIDRNVAGEINEVTQIERDVPA